MLEHDIESYQSQTEMAVREKEKNRRASKRQTKKSTVNFKYEIKLAKMEKQQTGLGGWISSFFTKEENPVKALAAVEHCPEQKDTPKNEYHTTV